MRVSTPANLYIAWYVFSRSLKLRNAGSTAVAGIITVKVSELCNLAHPRILGDVASTRVSHTRH